ncbi:hypothetical protein [Krasilnikovia sp. M28-CT-15]|uniref:aggregation-promoting factor C-terminal-like domain-containing protein n=1 Tax=Krasilnikovia sp. M28-CT-15 TaxID=3373540 RepID=UPI0038767753
MAVDRHTRRRTGQHHPDRGRHPRPTSVTHLLRHGAAVALLGACAALIPQTAATAHQVTTPATAGSRAVAAVAAQKAPARATSAARTKKLTARAANTPRKARAVARVLVAEHGWSTRQYTCLVKLWNKESRWRVTAKNSSSSAYGIPQALPGRKMRSAGHAWRTDAATQITWGLSYIEGRYASPCRAWQHSRTRGWY